jgi:membrane protein DedA with SNARE-associated domain
MFQTDFFFLCMESFEIIQWCLDNLNYWTVALLMAIESSFIPFPSEIVVPPAAYKAAAGDLSFFGVVLAATIGAEIGALVNYGLAYWLGRPVIYKFAESKIGRLCLLSKEKIVHAEDYFREHGVSSTLIGRLVPAVRQLISIPAGLAKMPLASFTLFTGLGAGIWVVILTAIGAWLGHLSGDMDYPTLINKGKQLISDHYIWIIAAAVVFGAVYLFIHKRVMKLNTPKED